MADRRENRDVRLKPTDALKKRPVEKAIGASHSGGARVDPEAIRPPNPPRKPDAKTR